MWISFGSVHEVRAYRERKRRSLWFRKLVESCVVYGDRGLGAVDGNVGVYNNGSTATLTATPYTGASFKGWAGDCDLMVKAYSPYGLV